MGFIKFFLRATMLICYVLYSHHASSQNNGSDSTKIYQVDNIDELLKYFKCPESGFTERDVVYIRFYLSKENIVQFVETKGSNTFMNEYSENIFKQIPSDVFKRLNLFRNDTLVFPIAYRCMGFDIDEKNKKKKGK